VDYLFISLQVKKTVHKTYRSTIPQNAKTHSFRESRVRLVCLIDLLKLKSALKVKILIKLVNKLLTEYYLFSISKGFVKKKICFDTFFNISDLKLIAILRQARTGHTMWRGPRFFILGEQQNFVCDTAFQSTKWLDILKIGGTMAPWPLLAAPMHRLGTTGR